MNKCHVTIPSLIVAIAIAGCATPFATPTAGKATLLLTPKIAPQRTVQALVEPWQQGDLKRVVLELYTLKNGLETPVLEGNAPVSLVLTNEQAFDGKIRFTNLKADTTYRVKAYGYQDIARNNKITVDASSSLDVPIAYHEMDATARIITLQLADKSFDGKANGFFDVKPSNLAASGSETFEFY